MKLIEKIRKNLVYRSVREFIMRFFTDGVGRAGAELAYFFLLSFFPLMIFTSLLIGTFHINVDSVQELLKGVIPADVLNIALNYIEYFTNLQARAGEENAKAGRDFLANNAKQEGVVVTESGLQYLVVKEGSGKKPGPNDVVTVHYTGRLIDGTVFDSSASRPPLPWGK